MTWIFGKVYYTKRRRTQVRIRTHTHTHAHLSLSQGTTGNILGVEAKAQLKGVCATRWQVNPKSTSCFKDLVFIFWG